MQSMAISLSDALGRTSEGDSELAQARHGLSVAQRKLLNQLGTTSDLDAVAREFGWDADYANRTATRLVELGLVERKSARAEPSDPEAGGARVLSIERGAPQRAKHWPILVALVVLGGIAAFWFSRSATAPAEAPAPPVPVAKEAAKPALPPAGEQKAPVALPSAVYSMTLRETQAASSPAQAQAAPAANAAHAAASAPAPVTAAAKPAPASPTPAAAPQVATRGLTPATQPAPAKAAPVAEAPKPAPVVAEPVVPKTLVASAAPTAAEVVKPSTPAAIEKALKVVSREAPGFPREALLANVNSGTVKARMTVDGNGNVVKVEVIEAQPRRVFDREVQRTLTKWKFEPTGQTQTAETEVVFNRE